MSDAVTLLVSPAALTDEQLSDALSLALADPTIQAVVEHCSRGWVCGDQVPSWIAQLLAEYKLRHKGRRR